MNIDMDQITAMLTDYVPKVVGAILVLIIGFWIIARITNVFTYVSRILK